jgi:hypothetical protein
MQADRPELIRRRSFAHPASSEEIVMENSEPRVVITPTAARTGSKEGVVRYVLGISLALVVVLFAIGYLFH